MVFLWFSYGFPMGCEASHLPRSETLRKAFEASDRPKQGQLGAAVDGIREARKEQAKKTKGRTMCIEVCKYIYIYIMYIYIYIDVYIWCMYIVSGIIHVSVDMYIYIYIYTMYMYCWSCYLFHSHEYHWYLDKPTFWSLNAGSCTTRICVYTIRIYSHYKSFFCELSCWLDVCDRELVQYINLHASFDHCEQNTEKLVLD